jgi:hypothetical protein
MTQQQKLLQRREVAMEVTRHPQGKGTHEQCTQVPKIARNIAHWILTPLECLQKSWPPLKFNTEADRFTPPKPEPRTPAPLATSTCSDGRQITMVSLGPKGKLPTPHPSSMLCLTRWRRFPFLKRYKLGPHLLS